MKQRRHLLVDLAIILASIFFALALWQSGLADELVLSLGAFSWLGVIIAGMFFTSIFTTAPAIVVLGIFAQDMPIVPVAILGGLGAMIGDYLIFRLVRDRVKEDLTYILSFRNSKRVINIFRARLFRSLVPFLGALVIASPLPDELGVAMLGLSSVGERLFLAISFAANSVGILLVGLAMRASI